MLFGDIRRIVIGQFNEISIVLTVDNKYNGINDSIEVRVDVPIELSDKVLQLKPDTCVRLIAIYKGRDVVIDTFTLCEIIEVRDSLRFPYYVCTGDNADPYSGSNTCNKIFGYTDADKHEYCPYCGSSVKKFSQVYSKEFKHMIGSGN